MSLSVRRRLMLVLIAVSCLVPLCVALAGVDYQVAVGVLLVAATALLPGYLWCAGVAHGIPIFPLYASLYLFTYGLPLLFDLRSLEPYGSWEKLLSSVKVSAFLAVGCLAWVSFARTIPQPPKRCLSMRKRQANNFFVVCIALSAAFTSANAAGWLEEIPVGLYSILRVPLDLLRILGAFVLSFRLGSRELKGHYTAIFIVVLGAALAASAAQLFLIGAVTTGISAVAGYFLGSKRIPWRFITIAFAVMVLLHYGKADMRKMYWIKNTQRAKHVQIWQLPYRYTEWMYLGVRTLVWERKKAEDTYAYNKQKVVSRGEEAVNQFVERVQLVYLFLRVQQGVEKGIPFMFGETFVNIPELVVPRLIHPDKPQIHENTRKLNEHWRYPVGPNTVIAWGLLNETYANFGFVACLILGSILGAFFGEVARLSLFNPILSARGLFSIAMVQFSVMSFSATLGILAHALIQISVGIVLLCAWTMEVHALGMTIRVGEPSPPDPEAPDGAAPIGSAAR